jgi:muconolactone delta-isomerase
LQTLKRALIAEGARDITEAERVQHEEQMEWCWKELWRPSFVPDLWCIDGENRTVHLFEIEDTSLLTSEKLSKLLHFWWSMDDECWDVHCTVFDRYGLQPRRINLQRAAFLEMGADTNSAGYHAAIKFLRLPPDEDEEA